MEEKLKKEIEERLKAINETYENALNELGDKVRKEVVIPVCKKHRLRYISGNGYIMFQQDKENGVAFSSQEELKRDTKCKFDLSEVFALLNIEVSYNQYLGYFVASVNDNTPVGHEAGKEIRAPKKRG